MKKKNNIKDPNPTWINRTLKHLHLNIPDSGFNCWQELTSDIAPPTNCQPLITEAPPLWVYDGR